MTQAEENGTWKLRIGEDGIIPFEPGDRYAKPTLPSSVVIAGVKYERLRALGRVPDGDVAPVIYLWRNVADHSDTFKVTLRELAAAWWSGVRPWAKAAVTP